MIIDGKFKEEWDKNEPHVYLGKKTEDILMNEKYLNEDLKVHLGTHIRYLNKYNSNRFVELKRNTEPDFMMRTTNKMERKVTVGKLKHRIKYDTFTIKVPWFNVYDTMYKLAKKYYKGEAYDENHQLYKDLLSPFEFLRLNKEKKWNSPSDNPLYEWTWGWEHEVNPLHHPSLRCFMKTRIKARKKYSQRVVEAKIEEKIKEEKAKVLQKQERNEALRDKRYKSIETVARDPVVYILCERRKIFTTKVKNKCNTLYVGESLVFSSRMSAYQDFNKPNNELVNKLANKLKKPKDYVVRRIKDNVRIRVLRFKSMENNAHRREIEGYLIKRLNPLINSSKKRGFFKRSFIEKHEPGRN